MCKCGYCLPQKFNNSGKLSVVGSRADRAGQTLAQRQMELPYQPLTAAPQIHTGVASGEEVPTRTSGNEQSFGINANKRNEWQVKTRRRNKRVGIFVIERQGVNPVILSADESESRKVIIWTTALPPVTDTYKRLEEILSAELFSSVLNVRNFGRDESRRVEVFCDSRASRDKVLGRLRARPLGLPKERCFIGRCYAERNLISQIRKAKVTETEKRVPLLGSNRFASLSEETLGQTLSLSVGVLNVNGLSPLFVPLWQQADLFNPALLAVTETYRQPGAKTFFLPGYSFMEAPMRAGTRRMQKVDEDSHGVGLFVKNDWMQVVKPLDTVVKFADCLWVKMPRDTVINKGLVSLENKSHVRVKTVREIWVGVYYFAPLLGEEKAVAAVDEISSICELAGQHGAEIVIVGDLNCCLRSDEDPLLPLRDGAAQKTRAKLLRQLLQEHDLCSLHELKPKSRLFTVSRNGVGRTMRDYIIVPRSALDQWDVPYVHCDADLNSDHWLLSSRRKNVVRVISESATILTTVAKLNEKEEKKYHSGWKISTLCPPATAEHDPNSALKAAELRKSIRDGLIARRIVGESQTDSQSAELPTGVTPIVPESYEDWVSAVEETLDEVLGRRSKSRGRKPPSYFTSVVWEALVQRRSDYAALRAAVNTGADEGHVEELWQSFLVSKKHASDVCDSARRAQWLTFTDAINSKSLGDRQLWKLIEKSKGAPNVSRWDAVMNDKGDLISPENAAYLPCWEKYYRELGTAKASASQSPKWAAVMGEVNSERFSEDPASSSPLVDEMNAPLTLEEVMVAIEGLPNHKAVGADGFSNEVLKALGPEALFGALAKLWDEEISPEAWALAILHPLRKPGDPTNLANSRGISLVSCVCKLFESVLQKRLVKYLEGTKKLRPEQGGFRSERECIEHILILTETLRRRKAQGLKSYVAFIDFSKAFDLVWRDGLWFKLHECGVKGKMLRVIRALYKHTEATVRVNGSFTEAFQILLGVRQGGVLSPTLFLVFINDLLDKLVALKIGVVVPGLKSTSGFKKPDLLAGLLWADDVAIVADSPEGLQTAFDLITSWCNEWLMTVNNGKCGVMIVGTNPKVDHESLQKLVETKPFKLSGRNVDLCQVYKYLGVQISYDLSWGAAISARIEATRKAVFACGKVLRNRDLSVYIRYRYFEAVVMPSALYGSELWANELIVCEKLEKMIAIGLRMIVGAQPSTSRVALGWEMGYVPFHIRVASRRMRLFQKWEKLDASLTTSAVWAKRIFDSRQTIKGRAWSWFRRTKHMVKKWLFVANASTAGDSKSVATSAALSWYRGWAREDNQVSARQLIAELHKDDTDLSLAPYLRVAGSNARILMKIRTGALWLNDRVSRFVIERASTCMSCFDAVSHTGVKENLGHFLMECPRYNEERENWCSGWSTTRDLLFYSHEPVHVLAALGESVQFFGDRDTTDFQACRMLSIRSMWRKRCVILAQSLPPKLRTLPLGVNAD